MNILILIIEDDKYMNETLQYVLKSEGYNVKSSLNALEAIKILKNSENKYDLLIVDYNLQYLKGINGFDIYEIAKDNNPDLKAIMVTAYASDKKIKKEAMSKGIDVLIEKPFLISDLVDAIEDLEKEYEEHHFSNNKKIKS